MSEHRPSRFFVSPGLSFFFLIKINWMVIYQVVHESSEQGLCDPGSLFSVPPAKMIVLRMKSGELNGLEE